jgi:signal transduction histidine kinase/ligand-binding sensor domain-containing protein/DNA-binding response OmpR family regulator
MRGVVNFFVFTLFLAAGWRTAFTQPSGYQFERIDMTKGLSHHTVNDILKDSSGFLWFGTSSGLNRYDGYSIRVFRNIPDDTTSLLNDVVTRLYEGPNGMLWIYSYSGNNVYDPRTESFHRNTHALLKKLNIADGTITSIQKDRAGNFWFVHYNQGLYYFDIKTKRTTHLQPVTGDTTSISSLQLSNIKQDKAGDYWLIHQNGVLEKIDQKTLKVIYRDFTLNNRFNGQVYDYDLMIDRDDDIWMYNDRNFGCFSFNPRTRTFTNFTRESKVKLNSNIVRKIVEDDRGFIWIGTENGGVNLLNKKTFEMRYLINEEEDDNTISENSIHALYKDREGIVWLGTYKNGISYYHPNIFRFQQYKHHRSRPKGLPVSDINAFAEDKNGNLWIGSNAGGLIYFDRKKNSFTQYLHEPGNKNSLSNNVIVSLLLDKQGLLWIGTYYGGLNSFDGRTFTHYTHDPANPKSLGDDNVWEIYEDSYHNLWIGTLKGGVDVFNRSKNEFYHYRSGEVNSIHTSYVPALLEDKLGNMWIGTGYGLEVLDKSSGRFIHYLNDPTNPESISSNGVLALRQDSRGLIWIGTQRGLNLFNPEKRTFRVFQEEDGLGHNFIFTLIEDQQRNIWMSTPKGLTKMTVKGENGSYDFSFQNYDISDGVLSGAFHENAVLKTSTGELIFGGSNGFNIFDPEKIQNDETNPSVTFTDFQLFNKNVKIGEEVNDNLILSAAISRVKKITLKPVNNVFSVEFAALNFFHPEKSLYKYKLEGFNKDWLVTDASQRRITFTNLDPRDYILKVKASNSDGIWGEEAELHITVLPPFWKTNLAFVLYAFLIIGAVFFVRWLAVTKERVNFRIQNERMEAQRMHELDMMKIKFFTNVSHEFRTPLTLIITPLEKFLKNSSNEDERKQFQLIHRNARRLLNLVNQLLDFRKMEVQEVKLNLAEGDIVSFIRDLVFSFSDLSEKKNIKLSFSSAIEVLETHFDQDKVEKILFNLLSNAFKFTPENGQVSVKLNLRKKENANCLELKVTDTGIGIPKDKLHKVFDRFFQSEIPDSMVNQGSGIGLSITHEFVKVHGGTIEVESEPGKGSIFTVLLPVTALSEASEVSVEDKTSDTEMMVDISDIHPENGKPTLLLVEDNEDFRFYLKDNLKLQYSIIEAANGKQGFQKALSVIPDLIVSDVMMPEMNGIELVKKLRTDPHTSHIPVILLTARTAQEQKIEGFESGANDYITKPFSFELLQSRIKNLISQREASQKQFQKHFEVKASEVQITSLDEKLIQKAISEVERNIANKDFSVEEMSRMLGMSRVLLYKKLLSLTGKTPIEFIRTIRLQRAAQLLEKSQYTVAEIAYQVGFNNPKYFARYFKEQYNMLPSAYASEKRARHSS